MQTAVLKFPMEIGGIECATLSVSITVNDAARGMLAAAGFGDVELANTLKEKARDIVVALDGSVPGLIVPSLEDL
jgi:hypothetical protein